MPAPAFDNPFTADAFEQVTINPTAGHVWRALMDQLKASDENERSTIVQAVERHLPDAGIAGMMRATFLAAASGLPEWTSAAADAALALAPPDASRLMVFAGVNWGLATAAAADHHAFRAMLLRARMPEIMRRLGRAIEPVRPPRRAGVARPGGAPRKVAVLAPHLGNAAHTPTRMALEQVALLARQGLEVGLFSCQETSIAAADTYMGCGRHVVTPEPDFTWLSASLPAGVTAKLGAAGLSPMGRWRDMLATISAWAPDVVMLVGLQSPLAFPLHDRYPVVGLSVHAVAPIAPVDVWLSADPAQAGVVDQPWGAALPPAEGHYHPFRIRRQAVTMAQPRAALGLADDRLVLVTVGARLGDEIRGDWAARMLALLDACPQVVWLLVGGNGVLPDALRAAPPGRIVCMAHTEQMADVLAASDVYVNPPRVGGGFSVAEAMAQAVPVVALAAGDAGAKLGAAAQPDDAHYFAQLAALIEDPVRRAHAGRAQCAIFESTLDLAHSGPSLLAACVRAGARAAARLD